MWNSITILAYFYGICNLPTTNNAVANIILYEYQQSVVPSHDRYKHPLKLRRNGANRYGGYLISIFRSIFLCSVNIKFLFCCCCVNVCVLMCRYGKTHFPAFFLFLKCGAIDDISLAIDCYVSVFWQIERNI